MKYASLIIILCLVFSCKPSEPVGTDFGLYQTAETGKTYTLYGELPEYNQTFTIDTVPVVPAEGFKRVEATFSGVGSADGAQSPAILMVFTDEGTKKLAKATKENIGKPILLIAKDSVIIAPVVSGEITNGRLEITGELTMEETVNVVNFIKQK